MRQCPIHLGILKTLEEFVQILERFLQLTLVLPSRVGLPWHRTFTISPFKKERQFPKDTITIIIIIIIIIIYPSCFAITSITKKPYVLMVTASFSPFLGALGSASLAQWICSTASSSDLTDDLDDLDDCDDLVVNPTRGLYNGSWLIRVELLVGS